MHLIEIPDSGIKKYFPADLSECDKKQYINMSALLYLYQTKQILLDTFLVNALYYLLDIKKTDKAGIEAYSNIAQLSKLILSFFDEIEVENEKVLQIKLYYIHNPIPSFLNITGRYYGPSDEFNNITFGEYVDALDPFEDFNTTGETKYLYQLLAIFYRPQKSFHFIRKHLNSYDGDRRVAYNSNHTLKRADKLKNQPIGLVYGFYLLFASFQKYITTVKIYIQGREIDFSILFDDSLLRNVKEHPAPGIGMKSILYSMAESGIFGDLDKVRNTNFWEIFIRMYDIKKRDLDMQANEVRSEK